jgi:hypothetical protein
MRLHPPGAGHVQAVGSASLGTLQLVAQLTPLASCPRRQVVRHERASIKADIWSYGILIWELVSGEDITEYQPLAISRQVGRACSLACCWLMLHCLLHILYLARAALRACPMPILVCWYALVLCCTVRAAWTKGATGCLSQCTHRNPARCRQSACSFGLLTP